MPLAASRPTTFAVPTVVALLAIAGPPPVAMARKPEGARQRVEVPAGPFVMGSERGAGDERPVHTVFVSAYRLDRHEVTNGRYQACVQAGACTSPALRSSHRRPRLRRRSA